jgi:hypothetical protein
LHEKAHNSVLCTFSTRTSATASGFARSSQLSSFRLFREGGMDRPSQHKPHPSGSPARLGLRVGSLLKSSTSLGSKETSHHLCRGYKYDIFYTFLCFSLQLLDKKQNNPLKIIASVLSITVIMCVTVNKMRNMTYVQLCML